MAQNIIISPGNTENYLEDGRSYITEDAGADEPNAVDDGIRGKDYFVIKGGNVTVNVGATV